MTFDDILRIPPYSLDGAAKEKLLTERLFELTRLHRERCPEYRRMLDAVGFDPDAARSCRELPFLPVRLFKEMDLKSVPPEDVVKTVTSSGTTGQAVSRIYLDRATASNQQKAMVRIVSEFIGQDRMPMIVIDCPGALKSGAQSSARAAGILGFSMFSSRRFFALDDEMRLDAEGLRDFLEHNGNRRILLFGFTFMVWQHFYRALVHLREQGISFDLSRGVLIHGGGWKKLRAEAVSRDELHRRLEDVCSLREIHDYYGMAEQTGCVCMECEYGHLHTSVFSDVIVRRPLDFSEAVPGETGIVQVLSTLPESYPGHSLLTEDEGVLLGTDDCPCGRKGRYFQITGRLRNAELRGCSDTYAAKFS